MPRTPQRQYGPHREDDSVIFTDRESDVSEVGAIWRNGSSLYGRDSTGIFNLRSGGGISESEHNSVRQLSHFIDDGPGTGFPSGSYKETLPSADPFPTSTIWWESSSKLKKIVELTITRNANKTPATEVWKMYDTDGSTVLETITDTISYSGIYETNRTRTWS